MHEYHFCTNMIFDLTLFASDFTAALIAATRFAPHKNVYFVSLLLTNLSSPLYRTSHTYVLTYIPTYLYVFLKNKLSWWMGCVNDRALWIVLCTINTTTILLVFYYWDLFLLLPLPVSIIMDHWTKFWGSMEQYNSPGRPSHFVVCVLCVSIVSTKVLFIVSQLLFIYVQKWLMFRAFLCQQTIWRRWMGKYYIGSFLLTYQMW